MLLKTASQVPGARADGHRHAHTGSRRDRSKLARWVTLTGAVAAIGAWALAEYSAGRLATAHADIARLQQTLNAPKQPEADVSEGDFVRHLPEFTTPDLLLREVQRSSQGRGVAFLSAQVSNVPPSDSRLGRAEITLELRGPYPELKAVLADAFSRYPNVVLKHLTIRRSPTSDLDARVELTMLSRPTGLDR